MYRVIEYCDIPFYLEFVHNELIINTTNSFDLCKLKLTNHNTIRLLQGKVISTTGEYNHHDSLRCGACSTYLMKVQWPKSESDWLAVVNEAEKQSNCILDDTFISDYWRDGYYEFPVVKMCFFNDDKRKEAKDKLERIIKK